MPTNSTLFLREPMCGRRERETSHEDRRDPKTLRAKRVASCWNGGRHPGLPENGALRGVPLERRPRSVRQRVVVSSTANRRAGDSGCPEVAKEGNERLHARESACTQRSTTSSSVLGDASFAWSSDSCTSILTTHRRSNPRWWGERWTSWLGKLAQAGGTGTGVHRSDEARLAARHRLRKEEGVTR